MESVSKEGLRAKPSSSINSNCQFESSLSRQTAKNRLCTAVLVTRSRDKFVDDAWNWSTVCPSSFRSSLPPCFPPVGKISRTQRFLFLDQRGGIEHARLFFRRSSKMGRRDFSSLGNTDFRSVFLSGHDRCTDTESWVLGGFEIGRWI